MKKTLILTLIAAILLTPCGIRPLKRPENNLSGIDESIAKETTPLVSETEDPIIEPVTDPAETYPHEYDPNLNYGNGVKPPLSYLADSKYIEEHTLGYCYIQNKGIGLYVGVSNSSFESGQVWQTTGFCLRPIEYATLFRVVSLDKGYLAFISPGFIDDEYTIYHNLKIHKVLQISAYRPETGGSRAHWPFIQNLWKQSLIVEKTSSGAYTLSTRMIEAYGGGHLAPKLMINPFTGEQSYVIFCPGFYTDDDDYTDEWIFIEAEPPESEEGTGEN